MNGSDLYEFEREPPQWMQCPKCLDGHMCETVYGFWCENCEEMTPEEEAMWETIRKEQEGDE